MTENESKDKSKFQECNDFPVVWSSGELTKQRKYSLVRVEDDQKFVIRYARPPMHTGLSIKPAKDKLLWEVEGRLNANLAESFGLRVVNEPRDRKVQASLSDDEIEAILDFGLIEATSDSKKSFNVALYLPTGMVLKFLRKTWRPNPEVKKQSIIPYEYLTGMEEGYRILPQKISDRSDENNLFVERLSDPISQT